MFERCITFKLVSIAAASVLFGGALMAKAEEIFTIAVIPDTQNLIGYAPQYWMKQCEWIIANREARNIKAVLHVGDLVNNSVQSFEWTNAMAGLNLLKEAGIPFILAPGNHDMDGSGLPQQMTNLNQALPQSWFTSNSNWTGGFMNSTDLTGSYLLVTNDTKSYVIVALAFIPDGASVNWGRSIMNQYSNSPAIFVTHCFVDDTDWGRRASWTHQYSVERHYGDAGPWWTPNQMWANWLSKSPNVFWVISGHLYIDYNSMYFSEPADDGHLVTQSLCNYQDRKGGNSGFMQLLTVDGDQNECRIETFSTFNGQTLTNWNEKYSFPLYSTNLPNPSRWMKAGMEATNNLILRNGFDRTNEAGFVGLSPYSQTLTGAIVISPGGIYVNAYPAFSNMVAVTDIDALTGLESLTVSVWYKALSTPPSGLGIIAGKFTGGTNGEWYLGTHSNSHLRLALVNTNNVRINLDAKTPGPVADGNWHYIVASYDGTTAKIYYDGEVLGSMPFSGRLKGTRRAVAIGGLEGQGSVTRSAYTPWGWIDRVKVWARALPPEEISGDYASDLATLNASRTDGVSSEHIADMHIATEPETKYFLRFAVAANASISSQQRTVVSWDGKTVADLASIQTGSAGLTNWVYTSLVVSSTNVVSRFEAKRTVGVSVTGSVTNSDEAAVLGNVTAVPFRPLRLPPPVQATQTNLTFEVEAYPGLAYQLQTSSDLVNWTGASRWFVASDTNLLLSASRKADLQRFYRVRLRW